MLLIKTTKGKVATGMVTVTAGNGVTQHTSQSSYGHGSVELCLDLEGLLVHQ